MSEKFTRIQVKSMNTKDPVKFFIPGSPNKNNVAYAKKVKGGIEIWNEKSKVVVPMEFPTGKKAMELEVSECEPHVVTVYYESDWPEFRLMRYGCSTLVCHDGKLQTLPCVPPNAVIYYHEIPQLVISESVNPVTYRRSACLLPLWELNKGRDVSDLYAYPEEAVVIESFAATSGAGRVHTSGNIPGTGCTYGDVPCIFAVVTDDGKQHGWALTLFKKWELKLVTRPEKDWVKHRYITYDPIWYENSTNEPYQLKIGDEYIDFPSLPKNGSREVTRYQINDVVMADYHRPTTDKDKKE